MPSRKIASGPSRVVALALEEAHDLRATLESLAAQQGLTWLLAHCEDGAIWGVMKGGRLALSSEAFPQGGLSLRWEALIQARLFGAVGEVLVWRGPAGWAARLRDDTAGDPVEHIDETQLLWGTASDDPRRTAAPFQELVEGRQGIRHAPPVAGKLRGEERARLLVRHYLAEDKATGVARVVDSRLVAVEPTGGRP